MRTPARELMVLAHLVMLLAISCGQSQKDEPCPTADANQSIGLSEDCARRALENCDLRLTSPNDGVPLFDVDHEGVVHVAFVHQTPSASEPSYDMILRKAVAVGSSDRSGPTDHFFPEEEELIEGTLVTFYGTTDATTGDYSDGCIDYSLIVSSPGGSGLEMKRLLKEWTAAVLRE